MAHVRLGLILTVFAIVASACATPAVTPTTSSEQAVPSTTVGSEGVVLTEALPLASPTGTVPPATNTSVPLPSRVSLTTPSATAEPITLTPLEPTPTIVYYPISEKPWDRIPIVVISSAKNDPRIPLVQKAVEYWNEQLKALGTPFHLGAIVQTTV